MRKNAFRQVIAGMVLLIAISFAIATVHAAGEESVDHEISPRYNSIISFTFTPTTNGHYASCNASVNTRSSYSAEITVEIQQLDGGWNTINWWSDCHNTIATVENVTYYMTSGCSYRFKGTAKVYDSSGNLLESAVRYSSTLSC